jgi:hypothetical protein
MTGVTRRQLLMRGGGVTIALLAAGAAPALAESLAADPALTAARSATALALLAAIAADGGSELTAQAVELVAADFADRYAQAPADVRAFADDTLDRIEAEGALATLSAVDALAVLRGWSEAGAPEDAAGDPHRTLAASALTLAGLAGGEDERREVGYTLQPA